MTDFREEKVSFGNDKSLRSDAPEIAGSEYRQEIIQTIDEYIRKLKNQKMDRRRIRNRLKLLQMREMVYGSRNLTEIEKELRAMSVDIEEPTLRMLRNISIVIVVYTVFAIASFVLLAATDSIMLPGFNIPYSVLLMGLIGSLVSMYVKLPNIRANELLSDDKTVWFIVNPPVAVIMAGIFFGIAQIFLQMMAVDLLDESWAFWIMACVVGLINWIYCYEWLQKKFDKSKQRIPTSESNEVYVNDKTETRLDSPQLMLQKEIGKSRTKLLALEKGKLTAAFEKEKILADESRRMTEISDSQVELAAQDENRKAAEDERQRLLSNHKQLQNKLEESLAKLKELEKDRTVSKGKKEDADNLPETSLG
jgi:F0F1-type ATP synthase epsilon subunit